MSNHTAWLTRHTRDLLAQRSGGICELCHANPATNAHHRAPRGMGGTKRNIHTIEWLLHLCGSGTTGCHGYIESHREEAYRSGWLLRQHQRPPTSPVWIHGPALVILTEDGRYKPWGAQGWQEQATKDTPGGEPEPSF